MEKRTIVGKGPMPSLMYCNNCGGKGHLFRMCRDPVLSCGLILIDVAALPVENPSATRVLMVRRKDSLSYAEFMRGKYDPNDIEYLNRLFSNMTIPEQTAIVVKEFDTLWRKLWGDDHLTNEYSVSREKFYTINRAQLFADNLSQYPEPEWGFPKGRRVRCESDLDCALREFNEETNIPREAYTLLKNVTLEETFMGLNGIRYKHIYYVALLKHPHMINIEQQFTNMQRREISAIAWKTILQCESHIRPHHTERHTMMNSLREIVRTFETL